VKPVNRIQQIQGGTRTGFGFFRWVRSPDPSVQQLLHELLHAGRSGACSWWSSAYFKETANTRMSMTMVFHIREAVYDKNPARRFSDSMMRSVPAS